jgi:dihydrofolate reductase
MRSVTYSMGVSLDGYIVGPDGGFDWTAPDDEVFRFVTDEIREVGIHLLGRRLYETMLYWETADQDPLLDDSLLEWAATWKPLPKVVFSTTLSAVQGNARLASGGVAEEIERLRAEPAEGNIAIGGATLAAEAAALGLIDEYRARVYPVLVGGGIPFFPSAGRGPRTLDQLVARTGVDTGGGRRPQRGAHGYQPGPHGTSPPGGAARTAAVVRRGARRLAGARPAARHPEQHAHSGDPVLAAVPLAGLADVARDRRG